MRVHSHTETLVVLDQGFRGTVVPWGEPDRRPVEMSTATGPSDARLKRHALIVWSGSRLLAVRFHTVYQLACPGESKRERWRCGTQRGSCTTSRGHTRRPGNAAFTCATPTGALARQSGRTRGISSGRGRGASHMHACASRYTVFLERVQGLSASCCQPRENPTGVFRIFHHSPEREQVYNSFFKCERS